jgi:hypothetical protein
MGNLSGVILEKLVVTEGVKKFLPCVESSSLVYCILGQLNLSYPVFPRCGILPSPKWSLTPD